MTTNVYDKDALQVCTDSRWSVDSPYAVFYVDDSGFEKIVDTGVAVFLFAGDSNVIQEWKDYLVAPTQGANPGLTGIAILMVDKSDFSVIFESGQDIQGFDAFGRISYSFTGSGARHAADCWLRNKCAKRSVESAKTKDTYSGGTTKYLNLAERQGNINPDVGLGGLKTAFMERGMVMYSNGHMPISIKEAATNDSRVQDLLDKIAQGSATLSAPCDAQFSEPTSQEEARLQEALNKVFNL